MTPLRTLAVTAVGALTVAVALAAHIPTATAHPLPPVLSAASPAPSGPSPAPWTPGPVDLGPDTRPAYCRDRAYPGDYFGAWGWSPQDIACAVDRRPEIGSVDRTRGAR